ncbi:Nicotinate-nucleotide--dimethylbenzimidazole phosphoribosyltransferase [Rhodovastum atsumiense]|uniref:Nicotinate-nucleotide--dimethylbenzimidazole phosphoribosyltransferase n=1 Tax=Rhodovastum atsumiense TaxID=504468 RepID=A0A5M6IV30_9PROT|nr:nicotinate-nucleotide--dimethylbenzimidazole phosphoribosyltransferase [Rhodovastum atsumiense]KAA5611265.1 nicotinate-nucleotide--dimethylbenzimidazole phosphoribosyltransferase [Rhodovastum atsumiense]CAH2604002.1 Nicotinate-nucleotide--dimethylbenzimidazole phosphoribosyltransferase [Rhodovastum atsumiense]
MSAAALADTPTAWTVPEIPPLARHLAPALQQRIDDKTKPRGAFGRLEELALRLGLMQATLQPRLVAPTVVIFAGDHGLAAEGVSPFPQEVSAQVARAILAGHAGSAVMARQAGLALKLVDAGLAVDLPPHPDLIVMKVRAGSRNALHEPALTPAEVTLCLQRGATVVDALAAQGCNALLPGEKGIGNSSAAALIYAALLERPLHECVGIGAGSAGSALARKQDVLAQVWRRHHAARTPLAALSAFGGCEIAMMTGAMLQAASRRMLVMVDGVIATAAMLAATRLAPAVRDYAVFAHLSGDGPHRHAVAALGGRPLLDLGLRLGEASGAALAWPLVRASVAMLDEMASFDEAGVSGREVVLPCSG